MGRYAIFFLLNRAVDTITLGTVIPMYSYYQERLGELMNLGVDEICLRDIRASPLPYEGKLLSDIKYFILHYCAGSWDGQYQVIHSPVSDTFENYLLKRQPFNRREYRERTDGLRSDFSHVSFEGDWIFQTSGDVNEYRNGKLEYCFCIVRAKINYSYTLVEEGGWFYMPVLKRNDPQRVEHQYATVFCLSTKVCSDHLHRTPGRNSHWIVVRNCQECQNSDKYDIHFYNLALLSDHYGEFLNHTRLII